MIGDGRQTATTTRQQEQRTTNNKNNEQQQQTWRNFEEVIGDHSVATKFRRARTLTFSCHALRFVHKGYVAHTHTTRAHAMSDGLAR
jgi:hypothetical protein